MTSRNLTEAAKKAGISRKTLYSYIHTSFDFAAAYQAAINEEIISSYEAAQKAENKALSVVTEILNNKDEKSENRLRAAQIILAATEKRSQMARDIITLTEKRNEDTEADADYENFKLDLMTDLYGPITEEELKAWNEEKAALHLPESTQ